MRKVMQIEYESERNRLTLDGRDIHCGDVREVLLPDRLGGGARCRHPVAAVSHMRICMSLGSPVRQALPIVGALCCKRPVCRCV